MNIHDKDQFAKAFDELGATSEPEAIRNLVDGDVQRELCKNERGQWYMLENGVPVSLEES